MERKDFLKLLPGAGLASFLLPVAAGNAPQDDEPSPVDTDSRAYWISVMVKISSPVLQSLSNATLKTSMPVESTGKGRDQYAHLEAFGRTLVGIAPWLELGPEKTPEGELRATLIGLARQCLAVTTDPSSPDFMNFVEGGQPLVDAAFLAHGLMRGYNTLWLPLPSPVKENIVSALKSTRVIKPGNNNWLLFSAMIEAFLLKSGNGWNNKPAGYALKKFEEWYLGGGVYGDGPEFHWDYYNSFVMHPMLLDIVKALNESGVDTAVTHQQVLDRARRYAAIQERLISPEGTYPATGRSLSYRFGAFQLLGQVALMKQLPEEISPAQVRSAMSAVIARQMEAPGTFDDKGWLTIGVYGHQPSVGETYISTGSLYLCTTGLLPLGLPGDDPFWTMPPVAWTSKKIWEGKDIPVDHALQGSM
jgi:hypothetical protein